MLSIRIPASALPAAPPRYALVVCQVKTSVVRPGGAAIPMTVSSAVTAGAMTRPVSTSRPANIAGESANPKRANPAVLQATRISSWFWIGARMSNRR